MSNNDVIVERHGRVTICTMNRIDQHNSITAELCRALLEAWRECDQDSECGAIITRTSGKHFSVGADGANLEDWTSIKLHQVFEQNFAGKQGTAYQYNNPDVSDALGMNRWPYEVSQITTPMIASIRGLAVGGGLGLALLHHFRISDLSAKFATAFTPLGLAGELGISLLLPNIVGQQAALRMLIANNRLDAQEALECNLVDSVVNSEELDSNALEFAEQIANQPKEAVRASLRALTAPRQDMLREIMELEVQQQERLWSSPEFSDRVDQMLKRIGKK